MKDTRQLFDDFIGKTKVLLLYLSLCIIRKNELAVSAGAAFVDFGKLACASISFFNSL